MITLAIYFCAFFGAVFCFAGLLLFFNQVMRGRKLADAQILHGVVESYQTNDDGSTLTQFRTRYQVTFNAEGRLVTTSLVSPYGSTNYTAVEAKLKRNLAGKHGPVFYRPDKPEDISSEPLLRRLGFCLLTLSVGLFISGVAALLSFHSQPLIW